MPFLPEKKINKYNLTQKTNTERKTKQLETSLLTVEKCYTLHEQQVSYLRNENTLFSVDSAELFTWQFITKH